LNSRPKIRTGSSLFLAASQAFPIVCEGLHAGMRERMTAARIADGTGLARAIQESYRVMWRRWCEGRSG